MFYHHFLWHTHTRCHSRIRIPGLYKFHAVVPDDPVRIILLCTQWIKDGGPEMREICSPDIDVCWACVVRIGYAVTVKIVLTRVTFAIH